MTSDFKDSPITLGGGWHDLETNGTSGGEYWRWASGEVSFKVAQPTKYKRMEFAVGALHLPNTFRLYANGRLIFEKKMTEKRELYIILELKGVEEVKIVGDAISPHQLDPHNIDYRQMTFMYRGFQFVDFDDKATYWSIHRIRSSFYDIPEDLLSHNINTNREQFISFPKLPEKRNVKDLITVVLTVHGNRLHFAKEAYASARKAGFTNILPIISGECDEKEFIDFFNVCGMNFPIDMRDRPVNNNDCWLAAVKEVKTPYTIILHDDDLLKEDLLDSLQYLSEYCIFAAWNAEVWDEVEQKKLSTLNDIVLRTGLYSPSIMGEILKITPLTISPVRGCFDTILLHNALKEWETVHGKDKDYQQSDTFVVGNDLFIWTYMIEHGKDNKCLLIPEVGSRCRSHPDSATTKDWNSENSRFPTIYSKLKNLHIKKGPTVGILMYMFKYCKWTMDNLANYKVSRNSSIKVEVFSDSPELLPFDCISIPKIEEMRDGQFTKSDKYSLWSFVEAIRIAKERNWDYFFLYEWDCKVGRDYWFDELWQEHLAWPWEPVSTGTPVLWYPKMECGNFMYAAENYIHKYSDECGVVMNIEYHSPVTLYTNGALSFYNVKKLDEYYTKAGAIMPDGTNPSNRNGLADMLGPYDLLVGKELYKDYKEKMFERCGWLPSSYSGCLDVYYNQEQREYMLYSGLKSAVHQIKYE